MIAAEGRVTQGLRLALIVLYGVPLLYLVLTSFRSNEAVTAHPTLVGGAGFSTSGYHAIVDAGFGRAALNSLQIALGVTAAVMVLGVPAAYALARAAGRAATIGLALLIVLQMTPPTATLIPLYHVLAEWHLLNGLLGVILANTALLLPFAILIMRPFFLDVPRALEEAAALDGAGLLRTFTRVVLPLARNGTATVAAIVFILAWGDFLFAITFITNPDSLPLSALLSQQITAYGSNWSRLMALATLTSLPVLAAFLLAQRRLRAGIALGGVK